MPMRHKLPIWRWISVALLAFCSAYISAAVFVVGLQLSLPPSDLAYDQPLAQVFSDPFVRDIAFTVSSIAGAITAPIAVFCLTGRHWFRHWASVTAVVNLFIIAATPWRIPPVTAFAAVLVALAVLGYCRFLNVNESECQRKLPTRPRG